MTPDPAIWNPNYINFRNINDFEGLGVTAGSQKCNGASGWMCGWLHGLHPEGEPGVHFAEGVEELPFDTDVSTFRQARLSPP